MTAAAIAAISASLWTVGAASPALADPVCVPAQTGQRAFCVDRPQVAANAWSVCTEQGKEQACQACQNALAALGDQNLSGWACGKNGTQGFYGKTKPPCYVINATNPTDQASSPTGCDGVMRDDGSIQRESGEIVPKPQLQFPS